jgi:hypothetical protein
MNFTPADPTHDNWAALASEKFTLYRDPDAYWPGSPGMLGFYPN